MKLGVTLPQFRPTPAGALAAARAADDAGLHGVFVFDHLWAVGNPDRPALNAWPLLGALSTVVGRAALGTLVARVSLLPDAVLVHKFETLLRMVGPHRLIAGLGTGDKLSEAENLAYEIPYPPAAERRADLAACLRRLRAAGVTTWCGGLSPAIQEVGRAEADALNVWGVPPEEVRRLATDGTGTEVTWGGPLPRQPDEARRLVEDLAAAGATWAVVGPPYGPDREGRDPRPVVEAVAGLVPLVS